LAHDDRYDGDGVHIEILDDSAVGVDGGLLFHIGFDGDFKMFFLLKTGGYGVGAVEIVRERCGT